jgi:hypothetical protein
MFFLLVGYNLSTEYSRIYVNIFLYQCLLDVVTFLKSMTRVRNNTATQVFHSPSAQLNKFNSHLKLIG